MYSHTEHHSKNELESINLQSVPNTQSVPDQYPIPQIKDELLNMQTISSEINNESVNDDLSVQEFDTLSQTLQNKEADLLSRSETIGQETHLELTSFDPDSQQCQKQDEMGMSHNENTNGLPLDTNHYYDNLTNAPIMVYQMPYSNIVPFDSIVSLPVAKTGQRRVSDTDTFLPNNFVSQDILVNPQNNFINSQPWYIVNEAPKFKGQINDKMLINQIYSSEDPANLFLDTRSVIDRNKCEINITEQIGTSEHISNELHINTDGNFNANVPMASDIHNLAESVYNSTDTDSEVALTLASLGNLKEDNVHQQNTSQHISLDSCFDSQKNSHDGKVTAHSICNENEYSKSPVENPQTEIKVEYIPKPIEKKVDTGIESKVFSHQKKGGVFNKRSCLKGKSKRPFNQHKKILGGKEHQEPSKNNLLGQLLKASKHCEPASLIPEGVVGDVIPAVGYRIMEMSNLREMIRMMHKCSNKSSKGLIVMQEQASLREGAVSQLSIICTGCKEGSVCATSTKLPNCKEFDINTRVEALKKEFNIDESQVQKMLEILGIFYRRKKDEQQIEYDKEEEKETEKPQNPEKKRKKSSQKIECKVCHKIVSGKNYLKIHMLMHDNSLHTCPYCHAYFKRVFNLQQHIKKHEKVKFECDYCHKLYTDRSTLAAHIKSIHLEEYRLECEVCYKRFFHRAHYRSHLRIHTKEKPFSCDICHKKYSHQSSVKKHMHTHRNGTKYKCRLCGKFYRLMVSIRQHLMQQHKLKKSDTEAQVITDVIAEVLPAGQGSSKQQILVTENLVHSNSDISTLPSSERSNIASFKIKSCSSDISSLELQTPSVMKNDVSLFRGKNFPSIVESPGDSEATLTIYSQSTKETTLQKNLTNWKKPP